MSLSHNINIKLFHLFQCTVKFNGLDWKSNKVGAFITFCTMSIMITVQAAGRPTSVMQEMSDWLSVTINRILTTESGTSMSF